MPPQNVAALVLALTGATLTSAVGPDGSSDGFDDDFAPGTAAARPICEARHSDLPGAQSTRFGIQPL